MSLAPVLAENSLFHAVGELFQPIFKLFATIFAGIYQVIPNYALAIALLTILIMAVLTPLTVKSTKSMLAMQRVQPEIKRLQQKYKGAENRAQLNEEMMRLYKEQGINPAGGCLPMLIQMPFLIVLYDVIRGITSNPPKYISHSTRLFRDLCPGYSSAHQYCNGSPHAQIEMKSFGINLALKPFPISAHGSFWAALPFFVLVGAAVVLQYVQMKQMTGRNPQAAAANPQMQMIQKIMPLIFAYIYFLIPAAVVIYMIISTMIRIGTQDIMFRTGIVKPVTGERAIPATSSVKSSPDEIKPKGWRAALAGATGALGQGTPQNGATGAAIDAPSEIDELPKRSPNPSAKPPSNPAAKNSRSNGARSNGATNGGTNGNGSKQHPRSKAKRSRKAR
jgi:YidC/Oxa1 family membrane protein insertase